MSISCISKEASEGEEYYELGKEHSITYNRKTPFCYQMYEELDLCYFQFNSMLDRSTYLMFYEMQHANCANKELQEYGATIKDVPVFTELLEEMFSLIDLKGIKTLVVDLSYNGGGNSLLSRALLDCLGVENEKLKQAQAFVKVSPFFQEVYPAIYEAFSKDYANKQESDIMGKLINLEELSELPAELIKKYFLISESTKKFVGKVFFMQSEATYSSAALLSLSLIDNNLFPVIGSKSSQKPSLCGDILFFDLPNTGIKGGVSSKIMYRPDASKKDDLYLFPSVEIPLTLADKIDGLDPRWEWIVAQL